MLVDLIAERKKFFAAQRAEQIRNKPPTRAQLRNKMLYEREQKWINDFVPMNDDSQQQAKSSKKRPKANPDKESAKKQKLEEDDDTEKEELRACLDIVPVDDIAMDFESLATKYLIVDWKTHILTENMMLENEMYETTSPEGYDLLLWGDLKTLFEPGEEDEIWRNQQNYNLISWRLFDSCGVHVLLMDTIIAIHVMVEHTYPLTQEMLSRMLNRRLEVDHESEMAFELLRHQFIRDSYEKKLIQVIKIHTDLNVADLLIKAFDVIPQSSDPTNLVADEAVYEEMYDSVERAARELVQVTTAEVKNVNEVTEIHALIDRKKIVVSEVTIRSTFQFGDEGGVECLPNSTIFEEIARMGYEKPSQKLTFYKAFFSPQWKFMIHTILQCLSAKTTAWNEFNSTVASAIICLATNQRFNFSKFILEGMLRNLDPKAVKFLMYPRFIQLFMNQVEGLPNHHRKYNVPCHFKKIFANMKRTNKDFSSNDTPLFPTMVVQTPTPLPTITPTTTTPPTTITPRTTTTTPPPTTTSTPTQPTTSIHPSQSQKQRVRKPIRRVTEVPQPSEPELVADVEVQAETEIT
ncbi:hypothetical protein Tco_0500511 [Tanacetum coccineum]